MASSSLVCIALLAGVGRCQLRRALRLSNCFRFIIHLPCIHSPKEFYRRIR